MELWRQQAEHYAYERLIRLLARVKSSGVMHARLSYSRICELEWDTGIAQGSHQEHHEALRAAYDLDIQLREERGRKPR